MSEGAAVVDTSIRGAVQPGRIPRTSGRVWQSAIAALVVFVISTRAAHAVDESGLRQVVGILDYIASDYAGAVGADGAITDEGEYHEQASLVADAGQLAIEAGLSGQDPISRDLSQLARLLAEHSRPDTVHEACRSLRRRIVEEQGLVLEPAGVPDLARARQLYRELGCVDCHGERGDAQTTRAATLDPHPANFLDPNRVAEVSPFRAFHALTFGVKGTAMASFDTVPASDRWDLAFYVLALRHQGGNSELGRRIVAEAGNPVAATASRLSQLTERDILAGFPSLPSDQSEAVLAWLRGKAPFERDQESRFALARQDLRDGVTAYTRGDASAARRILVQAYLRGIEPHEAGIRARAPALLTAIEAAMADLRQSVAAGKPVDEIERQTTRLGALLDRAEEGSTSTGTAFAASATIALREGLEMVLLVTALLAVARGTGVTGLARAVHGGPSGDRDHEVAVVAARTEARAEGGGGGERER